MLFLQLLFSVIVGAQTMPTGSHSIVINQCSIKALELTAGTSKAYLAKVHELKVGGNHCEAMNLFSIMIKNWQMLVVNHTSEELGAGYIDALESAVALKNVEPAITDEWVNYYLATIPDPARLPDVLRLSVEIKQRRVRGCDRNRDPIEKTLQESLVFQEMFEAADDKVLWQSDFKKVNEIKNEMLICLAMKRVREAEYMFLPKSERGIISFLTKSHAEVERNVLAAGMAYLGVIEKYKDVPLPEGEFSVAGSTFGELALSRLAELPKPRNWESEGQALMSKPAPAGLKTNRGEVAVAVFMAKKRLDQALALLAAQQTDQAVDLLMAIVLDSPRSNRYVMQAQEELKKLEANSLISMNWAGVSQRILKVNFEKGDYPSAKSHFFRLTNDMIVEPGTLPTLPELELLEGQVASEEKRLAQSNAALPQELTEIKKVLAEIRVQLTP